MQKRIIIPLLLTLLLCLPSAARQAARTNEAPPAAKASAQAMAEIGSSPSGRLVLTMTEGGTAWRLTRDGAAVLDVAALGVSMADGRGEGLRYVHTEGPADVADNYEMQTGKRRSCSYRAKEYVVTMADRKGAEQRIRVRLSDDGLAFRYELPGLRPTRMGEERTAYRIADGTRRWMARYNVAYEDYYPLRTDGRDERRHWTYPALIEPQQGVYALITEANIGRLHSASTLRNDADAETYRVVPAANEAEQQGDWASPWRVVIVGTLADVVASTLVTDVSDPARDHQRYRPGTASWIYWAHNHGSKDYRVVCQYIDMAAEMGLPYVLIDSEWDEMANGGDVRDALRYAAERGVRVLLWYNSTTEWIQGAGGPLWRLNTPEAREQEFRRLEELGVAGVKIDFFSGDTQATMAYCIDLLESAARHGLMVNLHGATVPRGWQRTYPNLMTVEAVYGAEWYNNVPTFTARAAAHNATLPFTRNVVGPMDYTPCAFSDSQHPHLTTDAHELALTVVFESGLQHLADRPESYAAQPAAVRRFLGALPTVWDETRLLAGRPGEYVVMARRSGATWYVGALNGSDAPRTAEIDLSQLSPRIGRIERFADGEAGGFRIDTLLASPSALTLAPRGGCVLVVRTERDYVSRGNPLFRHTHTADPAPLVRGDTLWLFTSHDAAGGQTDYVMRDWCLFSTTDLEHWTEHPTPLSVDDFAWAESRQAYACQCVERDGKFYLYTSTNWCGIGVAVSDRITGPYRDALGRPLLTAADCFASTHSWACIDPSVLIDDDGQAYLFWGNQQCYYARLKPNMTELDGPVRQVEIPASQPFTEGPWIHKRGGLYYLTYASGWPERIAYATSHSIGGPYEPRGYISEVAGNSNTTHPGIAEFRGEWLFFTHNGALPDGGSYSRSVTAERLHYAPDGRILPIPHTAGGLAAPRCDEASLAPTCDEASPAPVRLFEVPAAERHGKEPTLDEYFTPASAPDGAAPDAEGFIRRWLLLDPIAKPNRTNTVFTDTYLRSVFADADYAALTERLPRDGQRVRLGGRRLVWHAMDSRFYHVRLFRLATGQGLEPYGVLFWATTVIDCAEDLTDVRLAVGSNSASMWWVDGEEALLLSGDRRMVRDDGMSPLLTLRKGRHVLRGAVINGPGLSDFCVRLVDASGAPITAGYTVHVK